MKDLTGIVEALLFSSNVPITTTELAKATGAKEAELGESLTALSAELEKGNRAVLLRQVAGGWQLFTRPEYSPWIARLGKVRPQARLSQAALETLAIIAYRQPVTKAEVEGIRGVECSGVLRTLLERRMIEIGERKETAGRPFTYVTTTEFLAHFGLRTLADLPRMEEVEMLVGRDDGLFVEQKSEAEGSIADE
jgi:segregation and condensation protein B